MRRIAATLLLLGALAVTAVFAGGASGDSGAKYWLELDNAFGLIKGGDVKVAGVRAGTITDLKLDRATNRAKVQIEITKGGFGSLRSDVRCASRPQSLIGEYFVDCLPGTAKRELRPGSTIGVDRTESTVAPDLVNDILRRPYRERLSIILSSLGAAVAGNEENLNDAIRRAAPALRRTDEVLATLAEQNRVIRDLTVNADRVVGDLAKNKGDVGRFVDKAGAAAVASAERRDDIAAGFRRLPGFLRELTPTMTALGRTADAQAPTLRNLRASAGQLERFFGQLGPFADASLPAFKALGRAARTGDKAVVAAKPVTSELRRFSKGTPELAKNLAIVLRHLDDPDNYVEADPRAARATGRAMPTGYSGLEALLTYVYDQTMATNVYDQTTHILKIGVIPPNDECANYADAARFKEVGKDCAAALGPNQPGLTFTDPTAGIGKAPAARRARPQRFGGNRPDVPAPAAPAPAAEAPAAAAPAPPPAAAPEKPLIDVPKILGGLGDALGGGRSDSGATGSSSAGADAGLLDFLLGG